MVEQVDVYFMTRQKVSVVLYMGCIFYRNRYSTRVCADIGKYACEHRIAAAARHFTRKLSHNVSETTVRSIKRAYLQGVREKRVAAADDSTLK